MYDSETDRLIVDTTHEIVPLSITEESHTDIQNQSDCHQPDATSKGRSTDSYHKRLPKFRNQ